MVQTASSAQPTAEDLIFLLSIVRNPESIIAENESATKNISSSKHELKWISRGNDDASSSTSWQKSLSTFPSTRRKVVTAIKGMADANEQWIQTTLGEPGELSDESNGSCSLSDTANDYNEASNSDGKNDKSTLLLEKLERVEVAAATLRTFASEYLNSLPEFRTSIQSFWISGNKTKSEIAHVGSLLATELFRQLQWDEDLIQELFKFLDFELYECNNEDSRLGDHKRSSLEVTGEASNMKLRMWANAMYKMLRLDLSFWEFVEKEVYDETELFESDEPDLLNGEPSSQFISFPLTTHLRATPDHGIIDSQSPITSAADSLHERIMYSDSVKATIHFFLKEECESITETTSHSNLEENRPITSVLVVGEEGCGKTHMLDSIQQKIISSNNQSKSESHVEIIRPNFPVDLVGNSIGSYEDRLISLFSYALRRVTSAHGNTGRKCIIMLDDIDAMFSLSDNDNSVESSVIGSSSSNSPQFHVGRRCKALFLTMLDTLCEMSSSPNEGHLLLLCTSRSMCVGVRERFDKIFTRGQPDELERRQMILSCLSCKDTVADDPHADGGEADKILSLVVHHSAGRSAAEIAKLCREAILVNAQCSEEIDSSFSFSSRLYNLDKFLQSMSPPSLRSGSLDGVVEMRIFTPEELQRNLIFDADGSVKMPLLGADAKRAYEALMNIVITPLCRSDEIRQLLYGESSSIVSSTSKSIRVGALLAGAPGVGKSSLAYHCASLAARIGRVSLLEVSCTSLIHKEIGGSERAVHQLFAAVRAAAPCILLLDGVENIAPLRGHDNTSEGTMDRVLSTFLTEMDGIESDTEGGSGNVAVIGITQYPNLIDPSLRRPGRLEKTIELGTLDFDARKELITMQVDDLNFDFSSSGYFDAKSEEELSHFVATASAGMSAAEVIAICTEAKMQCLRELNFEVTSSTQPSMKYQHFKTAVDIMKGKL